MLQRRNYLLLKRLGIVTSYSTHHMRYPYQCPYPVHRTGMWGELLFLKLDKLAKVADGKRICGALLPLLRK